MQLQVRNGLIPGLLIALIGLAGCGSSSSSSSRTSSTPAAPASSSNAPTSPPTPAVKLAADPSGAPKFNTTSLTANAGKVALQFTNNSSEDHNVTVASSTGAVLGATPTFHGGTKTLTLNLKPGTYTFYCSVPGHQQAGMQGTLVVK